jgi:hypothetical protein
MLRISSGLQVPVVCCALRSPGLKGVLLAVAGAFDPAAPLCPLLSAAVEGGALRLLEQLSRAAAGSDAGRAAVASKPLFQLNSKGQAALGRLLLSLLAHSPTETAASFIVTQAKHSAAEYLRSRVPRPPEQRDACHPHVLTEAVLRAQSRLLWRHMIPDVPAAAAAAAGDVAAVQRYSVPLAAAWAWLPLFADMDESSCAPQVTAFGTAMLKGPLDGAVLRAAQLAAVLSTSGAEAAAADWRVMLLRTRPGLFGTGMLMASVSPTAWRTSVPGVCAAAAVLQRELRAAVGGEGAGLDAAAVAWAAELLRGMEPQATRGFLRRTDVEAEEQPRFQHACGAVKTLAALRVRLVTGAGWGPAAEQELQCVVGAWQRPCSLSPSTHARCCRPRAC